MINQNWERLEVRKKAVKNKEEKQKGKAGLFVWWAFWIIYLELIYRIFVIGDFWSFNTLSVIEFCVPLIVINTIITSLFSEKVNNILNIILFTLYMPIL